MNRSFFEATSIPRQEMIEDRVELNVRIGGEKLY